jgi:uncharacterized protein YkwD
VSRGRALTSFALIIAVALLAPGSAAAAPVGDCQAGAGWPASLPSAAADVVQRVNAHRVGRGLAPLAISPTLAAAAEWKARHMAQYGYLQHDDPAPPVQRSPFERMEACGYPGQALTGENIASGYDTPASVMAGWLGSAGHRANLERPQFRAIGVGVARSAAGTLYWAQNFGSVADASSSPPAAPPAPPSPVPPAPPPPDPDAHPAVGEPLGRAATVRVRGCRRSNRSRRVRCRLVVSAAPITVHARLRQRGTVVASGTAHAESAGLVRLRLRGRGTVRPGRGILRMRVEDVVVRRPVRVR